MDPSGLILAGGHSIADDGQVRSRRKAHLPVVPIASRPLTVDNTSRRRSPTDQPAPSPKGASSLRRSLPQHLHQLRASTAPSPEPSTIPGASRGQQRCSTAAQPGGAGNRGRFLSTPQASVLSGNRRTKTVQRGVVMPLNQSAPIVEGAPLTSPLDVHSEQALNSGALRRVSALLHETIGDRFLGRTVQGMQYEVCGRSKACRCSSLNRSA